MANVHPTKNVDRKTCCKLTSGFKTQTHFTQPNSLCLWMGSHSLPEHQALVNAECENYATKEFYRTTCIPLRSQFHVCACHWTTKPLTTSPPYVLAPPHPRVASNVWFRWCCCTTLHKTWGVGAWTEPCTSHGRWLEAQFATHNSLQWKLYKHALLFSWQICVGYATVIKHSTCMISTT